VHIKNLETISQTTKIPDSYIGKSSKIPEREKEQRARPLGSALLMSDEKKP
jgi:hypothetical protein